MPVKCYVYVKVLLILSEFLSKTLKLYFLPDSFTFSYLPCNFSGPDSVVGIATGYELDGPGIESRWGRDFPYMSRPVLGPTQPPVRWVPDFSRG